MKNHTLTALISITCVILLLSSCANQTLYDELESEYNYLKDEYEAQEKSHEDYVDELMGDLEYCYDMVKYYELVCQKHGLLTHEQAYKYEYYYIEPNSLIYHTDYYCEKADRAKLQIVDIFLYSALEKCLSCKEACDKRDVIRLIDPSTMFYHYKYEPCAPHFTKDYITISVPYIATTEQKAKDMKYKPCPICISE